jgi:aspartate/methionine/tyrosine aminotransferase
MRRVKRLIPHVVKRRRHESVVVAEKVKDILGQGNVFADFTILANKCSAMNLGQGFPSFGSPPFLASILNRVTDGDVFQMDGSPPRNLNHQYTVPGGDPLLTEALSREYSKRFERILTPENICTTVGAQEAIFVTLASFCNPQDEIIVITPAFDSYFKSASVCGLVVKSCPMVCNTERPDNAGQYRVDPMSLRAKINARTKMLVLNNPSSPLGKVFSKSELIEIANIVKDFPNLIVLSDEVYEHHVYDEKEHHHIALGEMWKQTITVFSAGKSFSCTGWRLGYMIGPHHLIKPIKTLHAAINFSTSTVLQKSVAYAFGEGNKISYFRWLSNLLEKKRNTFCKGLESVNMPYVKPEGGYFVVADASKFYHLAGINEEDPSISAQTDLYDRPDVRFAKWLTTSIGVSPIPMSPFYPPKQRHLGNKTVRFAFCKDDQTLQTAIERLQKLRNPKKIK